MFLTAVGQCRLLDTVPWCCQEKWASLLRVSRLRGGARGFNTTILTVGTRDVQGAVRSPVLLHLRSRPPGLADFQHRVSVTNPLSFSLDWGHSVMAQKSSVLFFFFSTLMEHKLWQQKRWANCNYTTIRNAFCILQQFWGKWRVYFETSLQRWEKKSGEGGGNPEVPSGSPVQRLTARTGRWICLFTQLPVTCDWGETWKTLIL